MLRVGGGQAWTSTSLQTRPSTKRFVWLESRQQMAKVGLRKENERQQEKEKGRDQEKWRMERRWKERKGEEGKSPSRRSGAR